MDPDPRRLGDGAIPDTKTLRNGRLVSVIILIGGSVSNNINRGKCLRLFIPEPYHKLIHMHAYTHAHTLSHTT